MVTVVVIVYIQSEIYCRISSVLLKMQRFKYHASIVKLGITNTVGECGIPNESLVGVFMILFSYCRFVKSCDL